MEKSRCGEKVVGGAGARCGMAWGLPTIQGVDGESRDCKTEHRGKEAVTSPELAVTVPMGELQVRTGRLELSCQGLGSCVGFFVFDPQTGALGMGHFMLPRASSDPDPDRPGKYVDSGMEELLRMMLDAGANIDCLVAYYAGGADVLRLEGPSLGLGDRNIQAVKLTAERLGVKVLGSDAGGTSGRSLTASTCTGRVTVRRVDGQEKVLGELHQIGEAAA
jgi:chemotaxis protein CheD